MSHPKRGLKALGLSLLAALGLMAFTAAGAQANWLIEGVSFHGTESVEVNDHVDGLLLVPAKNLEILCHNTTDEGIVITELTRTKGALKFSECLAFQMSPLTRIKNCDPINTPIVAGGKGGLILHNGKNYVLFEPTGGLGGIFTTVEFSELCALTETSEVTGSLVGECGHLSGAGAFVGLDCATNQLVQLVREAPNQALFGDGLKFGENAATIDGIASAVLDGANAHKKFGGHI